MGLNLELGSFLTGGKAMVIRRSIKETEDSSVKDTQPHDPLDDLRHGRFGLFVVRGLGLPNWLDQEELFNDDIRR